MVYIHFPANFTEEELNLQAKYTKLKKKKKALQALKAPKPEPEKPIAPKRPTEARDAREVAKKLIKSGVITAIPKQQKQPEHGFKRPRGQERKLILDKVQGYQPFSAVQSEDNPNNPENNPPRIKNLYDSHPSRERDERGNAGGLGGEREPRAAQQQQSGSSHQPQGQIKVESGGEREGRQARTGNTVYVSGFGISEEFLRKHLGNIGAVSFITMEIEKNRGFVTFDETECAERAIAEMDGSMVSGIQLNVSLARRQPQINRTQEGNPSAAWTSISTSTSQKGNHRDKRELVSYDDLMDF